MARPSKFSEHRRDVLIAIKGLSKVEGKPPTVRELSETTGVSVSTMHAYIMRLHDEGLVTWQPRSHRSIRLTMAGLEAVQ